MCSSEDCFVAVKVHQANCSEIHELEARSFSSILHEGKNYVQAKLDSFTVRGPNGLHSCIVFQPLGRTFEDIIDNASFVCQGWGVSMGLTKWDSWQWSVRFAQQVCRQVILGLDYLHTQRIAHRDIQPGNLMLDLKYDIQSMTENQIQQDVWDPDVKENEDEESDSYTEPHSSNWSKANLKKSHEYINLIKRLDGQPLRDDEIHYTVGPVNLHDRLVIDDVTRLKISFRAVLMDLGAACDFSHCNETKPFYPVSARPPEMILGLPTDEKGDIWAAGFMLWRIVMLEPLVMAQFSVSESDSEWTNDQQLRDIVQRLGPIPVRLRAEWCHADKFVNAGGALLIESKDVEPGEYWYGNMVDAAAVQKPKDMSEGEVEVFLEFIQSMLQWEPAKRASTEELLKHRWFTANM